MHMSDIQHALTWLQRRNTLGEDLNVSSGLATAEARDLSRAYLSERTKLARGKIINTENIIVAWVEVPVNELSAIATVCVDDPDGAEGPSLFLRLDGPSVVLHHS